MSWDEKSEKQLAELWGAGWSASQIGARLGQSRNAVIGKAHRLKLPKRRDGVNAPAKAARPAPARAGGHRSQFEQPSGPGVLRRAERRREDVARAGGSPLSGAPRHRLHLESLHRSDPSLRDRIEVPQGEKEKMPRAVWRPLPGRAPVALVDLDRGQCRWPLGDPREPGFGFCGLPVAGDRTSYCTAHHRVSVRQEVVS